MAEYQYKEQGNRLEKVRKELNLKRADLAKELHITENAYGAFERGNSNFSIGLLRLLAEKYNVNITYILCGKGQLFINDTDTISEDERQEIKDQIEKLTRENLSLREALKNLL